MVDLPRFQGAFSHSRAADAPFDVPFHAHPHHELILVTTGRLRTAMAGEDHSGGPGILHVVPAGVRHDQRCAGPWSTRCVLWDGASPAQPASVDLRGDPLARRLIHDLIALHREGAENAVTGGLLLALLGRVLPRIAPADDHRPAALQRALAVLAADLAAPLSDEQVAQTAGISVSHLGALCRQHLGCGPLAHRQRLRLELAARLLADPYTPVAEVARRCGYQDPTHFIRHFRRQHGCTPGRWRSADHPRAKGGAKNPRAGRPPVAP